MTSLVIFHYWSGLQTLVWSKLLSMTSLSAYNEWVTPPTTNTTCGEWSLPSTLFWFINTNQKKGGTATRLLMLVTNYHSKSMQWLCHSFSPFSHSISKSSECCWSFWSFRSNELRIASHLSEQLPISVNLLHMAHKDFHVQILNSVLHQLVLICPLLSEH